MIWPPPDIDFTTPVRQTGRMTKTYTVAEAGQHLPELLAEAVEGPVPITRDDRTVAFLVTPEKLETLEILADPAAMEAIREARKGQGVYHSLEEFERRLGDED